MPSDDKPPSGDAIPHRVGSTLHGWYIISDRTQLVSRCATHCVGRCVSAPV